MRLLSAALLVLVLACGREDAGVTLTVFAASSLTDAFEEMATAFEDDHSDVDVVLNLAGSQTLATQIVEGAAVDIFASADMTQMERAVLSQRPIAGPETFATNRLVIAVAKGNPEAIETLADLARDDLTVVLGAEEVPVGRYGNQALEEAGVEVEAASYETNVGLVLSKVALGEADAGIVYQSDLRREDDVEGVAIPDEVNVKVRYPVAAWERGTGRAGLAHDFIEFVTSQEGQAILEAAGFDA